MRLPSYIGVLALAAGFCLHGQSVITTIAGGPRVFPSTGVPATSTAVNPSNVAVRVDGTVFISDGVANVVLQVSTNGMLSVVAGNGLRGFSGDGGPATSASLGYPGALAVDSSGALFISDFGRIRKVAADGTIATVAAVAGADGLSAMAIDKAGNIFVSATNRIQRITSGVATTVAGNGTTAFSGDGGPATGAGLNLFRAGLAVDNRGNLYISDPGNQRIRRVDSGGIISTFAGDGTYGSFGDGGPATKASLGFPEGLALDTDGGLIIADTVNNRVRRVDPAGIITTIAGNSDNVFQGDGVPATSTGVGSVAVAVGAAGDIFIADQYNFRLRRVERATGIVTTSAGNGNGANPGDGGPATSGGLSGPSGAVADKNGNVYITDSHNNRVRRVDPRGIITTVAGTGGQGYSGDGGSGPSARVAFPVGIALSPAGDLYFTDSSHVRKLSSAGIISTFAGALDGTVGFSGDGGQATSARLLAPSGLAFDSAGNLYIADTANCRVRRVTPSGIISTVAGNGTCGFGGDGGPAVGASLNSPAAVSFDARDALYIADFANYRVRRVTADGVITTVAGNGAPGNAGDNGPATAAALSEPCGLAFDKAGNLLVANCMFPQIRKITPAGVISTIAGASRGFSGDGGSGTAAALSLGVVYLAGIAVDAAGNILIPDGGNDRVRAILANAPLARVTPAALTFPGTSGGVLPAPQRITIDTDIPAMPFSARAIVSQSVNWLQVSPANGFTPTSIVVTANPSQLPTGTYQGSIEINVPNGNPATTTVAVTFVVGASLPPKLRVDSPRLTLGAYLSGQPATGAISINNIGGGVLTFAVSAATDSGGNWLSATPPAGTASPSAPASLVVAASPGQLPVGVYTGRILIASFTSGEQASVPVTMIVSAPQSRILLSHSGMSFLAVAGGTVPPQQGLSILNRGLGTLTWSATARALSGNSTWLSLSQGAGTVSRPSIDASTISVGVDATNLPAGVYYGQVVVSAAGADSGSQSVTVVLSVVDLALAPGPQIQPLGLIFTGRSGSAPGSQNVFVRNSGVAPLAYNSAQLTLDGANWLQYIPPNANVARTQPQKIAVQPGPLPPGVYDGSITLLFEDGTISVTRVKTVVAPVNCTPTRLILLPTNVEQFFSATLYLPMSIDVQVVDDCGVALTADRIGASLTMSFSNGDRTGNLIPTGNGNWSATWQPVSGSPGPVYITLSATLPLTGRQPLTGSVDLEADLAGSVNVPVAGALLNAASFVTDSPVAPGSLVSLFGANLADSKVPAAGLPLGTSLGNTQVRLGGTLLPLAYASDGQINAQVPTDIAMNTELQLSVSRGTAISVPQPIVTALAAPGVFTRDQSGTGAGLIVDGATNVLNDADHPAKAGDTIVIYCTGLGLVTPLPPSGEGAGGPAITDNPVTLTIGGLPAQVSYAGLTPGFPGLYQINAVVAAGTPSGNQLPVELTVARQISLPVTMSVR